MSLSVEDEEVEFGWELSSDELGSESSDSEDESTLPSVSMVTEKEHCQLLLQDDMCLTYLSQLRVLSTLNVTSCQKCGKPVLRREKFIGSALHFIWVCNNIIHLKKFIVLIFFNTPN